VLASACLYKAWGYLNPRYFDRKLPQGYSITSPIQRWGERMPGGGRAYAAVLESIWFGSLLLVSDFRFLVLVPRYGKAGLVDARQ